MFNNKLTTKQRVKEKPMTKKQLKKQTKESIEQSSRMTSLPVDTILFSEAQNIEPLVGPNLRKFKEVWGGNILPLKSNTSRFVSCCKHDGPSDSRTYHGTLAITRTHNAVHKKIPEPRYKIL